MLKDIEGNFVYNKDFKGSSVSMIIAKTGESFFVKSAKVYNKTITIDFTKSVNVWVYPTAEDAAQITKDRMIDEMVDFTKMLVTRDSK